MTFQPLPIGHEIIGHYVIETVLGSGGFGIAYQALDTSLNHRVVLKEYFPRSIAERAEDQVTLRLSKTSSPRRQDIKQPYRPLEVDEITAIQFVQPDQEADVLAWGRKRFVDEAQTLARLRSPSIPQVFRIFEANDTVYMALEKIEGSSLKAVMSTTGSRPSQASIDRILEPLLDALSLLHAQGIVHGDVSPNNIHIRPDGSPALLDFGSARKIDGAVGDNFVVVTPPYAAPELYRRGQGVKPTADIYAVGAIAHELVTGCKIDDAGRRLIEDNVPPLARMSGSANYRRDFLRAVDWALSLDPARRPQSVDELIAGMFPWKNLAGRAALNRLRGKKIFISYRRADSRQQARLVYAHLTETLGADQIFFDVDSIPYGVDFRNHIRGSILESAVVLAFIGPTWTSSFKSTPWMFWQKARDDFVRIELELALEHGIPIVPVLLDGTPMPDAKVLPPGLADMIYANAAPLRVGAEQISDLDRLLKTVGHFRD